jgi:hypothetical protein
VKKKKKKKEIFPPPPFPFSVPHENVASNRRRRGKECVLDLERDLN